MKNKIIRAVATSMICTALCVCTAASFTDTEGHWAETYVNTAVERGLFRGDGEGNFNPDDTVTRAQFVTVLYRMAGSPEPTGTTPFTDTEGQHDEFKSAIAWAYCAGYITGTTATTFDPNGTLTREAAMKILHAYFGGVSGMETMFSAVYDGTFKDSADVSTWAKKAVYWGLYNKIITGTGTDTLSPKASATRAQLAVMLVNYMDRFDK